MLFYVSMAQSEQCESSCDIVRSGQGSGTHHEQSVIGPGANDPDFNAVLRIPLYIW